MKIEQIKIKDDLYPRNQWSWHTSYAYSQMMKAKANFPSVVVAYLNGNYILVDGRHRIEALKMNGEKYVSVEILKGLTKEQIFLEAVQRNAGHGRPLSAMDKAKIIIRLQDMHYPSARISELVRVPIGDLKTFVMKRVTSSLTGEPIVLKSSMRHLSDAKEDEFTVQPENFKNIEAIQGRMSGGHTQVSQLQEIRLLLESAFIDRNNPSVIRELKKIYVLVGDLLEEKKEEGKEQRAIKKELRKVKEVKRGRPKTKRKEISFIDKIPKKRQTTSRRIRR